MLKSCRIYLLMPALAVFVLSACSANDSSETAAPHSVSIMTFNVQNLFDTADDPNKDDKAYLPIESKQSEQHIASCNEIPVASWRDECLNLDWNEDLLQFKLSVLAASIRQIDDGQGADIIVFQEVENAAVVERLRTEYLADAGYLPTILIEGDDLRGIDTAFLSKLPLASPAQLRRIAFDEFPERKGDTRHILEATFTLPDGSLLTGFAVHFPAPYQPTEMRVAAYDHLNALRDALPDERSAFAAGDFNTTSSEDQREHMLDRFVRPNWIAAHDLCDGCPGSYYYARDDDWSFLDMILFSPPRGEKTTWRIRADSVRIANQTERQVTDDATPAHFEHEERTGVSDHWPLTLMLEST